MARGLSEVTSQPEAEFGLAAWAYTPSLPLSLASPQWLVGQLVPGCTERSLERRAKGQPVVFWAASP